MARLAQFWSKLSPLKTYSLPSAAFAALSETLLQAGTAVRFRASGASMLPLIQKGDILLVKPVVPHQIHVGDVVLFTKWGGTEIKIDGEELLVLKESDIIGIVDKSASKKKAA